MKIEDLKKLSTPELLSIYNTHATKAVARFSDRSAALRRTAALLEALGDKPVVDAPAPASLKMAAAKSRSKVLVARTGEAEDAKEFHSVKAAFIAFKLPLGVHKRFRRKLKLSGEETFQGFIFKATYHNPKKRS